MVKGLTQSFYKVDNETYSKYKTTTPQPVLDATNIREIDINNVKYRLNFWNQMDYPFLLNATPTDLYKFIVGSNDASRTNDVLKQMVSDRQRINREAEQLQGAITILDTQIQQSQQKAEVLNNLNTYALTVLELKHKFDSYVKLKSIVEAIKTNTSNLNINTTMLNLVEINLNLYNRLSRMADNLSKLSALYSLYSRIKNLNSTYIDLDLKIKAYDLQLKVYDNFNIDGQVNRFAQINRVIKKVDALNDRLEELELSETQIFIPDITPLIDKFGVVAGLNHIINKNTVMQNRMKNIQIESDQLDEEINKVHDIKHHFKVCPLCNQDLK